MLADLAAQNIFVAGLVGAFIEVEAAAQLRLFNTPPGQDLGQFGYIFLRVTAVHAERVQLHDFARVIFIQAAGTVLGLLRTRPGKRPRRPMRLCGP